MYKIVTIVAYTFYVYYFKNATIVAYAGLRVKLHNISIYVKLQLLTLILQLCVNYEMVLAREAYDHESF